MVRRVVVVVVLPLIAPLGLAGYVAAVADRLPEQIVTRWGLDGFPSGATASPATVSAVLVVICLVAVVPLWALAFASGRSTVARRVAPTPAAVAWFLAVVGLGTVVAQLDGVADPTLAGWVLPVALGVGLAAGLVADMVGGPPPIPGVSGDAGSVEANTVIWSGRTPPLSPLACVITGFAVFQGLIAAAVFSWWIAVVMVPVLVLLTSSFNYRVAVGTQAVDISGVPLGSPRVRVPVNQIHRVDVGTVQARDFGGYGIRRPIDWRERAVLSRSGPALVITQTDGFVVRVSLDDPGPAVAALSSVLHQRVAPLPPAP